MGFYLLCERGRSGMKCCRMSMKLGQSEGSPRDEKRQGMAILNDILECGIGTDDSVLM